MNTTTNDQTTELIAFLKDQQQNPAGVDERTIAAELDVLAALTTGQRQQLNDVLHGDSLAGRVRTAGGGSIVIPCESSDMIVGPDGTAHAQPRVEQAELIIGGVKVRMIAKVDSERDWYVELETADEGWRLCGEMPGQYYVEPSDPRDPDPADQNADGSDPDLRTFVDDSDEPDCDRCGAPNTALITVRNSGGFTERVCASCRTDGDSDPAELAERFPADGTVRTAAELRHARAYGRNDGEPGR